MFEALFGCHDVLILGKSPMKWRQQSDMTIVVEWDVKHQFKQTKKLYNLCEVHMNALFSDILFGFIY